MQGRKQHFAARPAFTFVEVIAALAIVSISLLGLLKLHLTSIKMVDRADAMSQAVFLAQEKIAETLALGYPKVAVSTGTAELETLAMQWRTEVSDLAPGESACAELKGLRKIAVDVTWKQKFGRRHLQMETLVADRKLQ